MWLALQVSGSRSPHNHSRLEVSIRAPRYLGYTGLVAFIIVWIDGTAPLPPRPRRAHRSTHVVIRRSSRSEKPKHDVPWVGFSPRQSHNFFFREYATRLQLTIHRPPLMSVPLCFHGLLSLSFFSWTKQAVVLCCVFKLV